MSGWLAFVLAFTAVTDSDVVVVRPAAWAGSIQAWKAHREEQGYRILEVTPASTAEATRDRIRDAVSSNPQRLRYIVLAADAPALVDRDNESATRDRIPAFYVDSKVVKDFGSEPTIVTDYPYANFDPQAEDQAAVGRIPANSAAELRDYFAKVIRYEASASFKPWRREVDIVAGVGGFGAFTDAVVEGATRQLLTADIPPEYRLSMTYASPTNVYYPAPSRFSDTVIKHMNDGGLFWIYMGHGYVNTLDYIPHEDQLYAILDRTNLHKISVADGPPIGIFLACYVGAFDAREASIAEQLLLASRGPIAIIAGSRVTMPYGMGILGGEMLEECFLRKAESIGAIFQRAKQNAVRDQEPSASSNLDGSLSRRAMLDSMAKALSPEDHSLVEERAEHNYLFNLLGDPMLRIDYPSPLRLETNEEIPAGTAMPIHGHSPIGGQLVVELNYTRQRVPDSVKSLEIDQDKVPSFDQIQLVYEAANRPTVNQLELTIPAGDFQLELPIDPRCHGSYIVQATVYSPTAWSAGAAFINVKRR